jgi:predicted metalloendopeptidase
MKVDGKLTLVENLADIGGLEFALAGLRSVTKVGKAELREFFTSYAASWRSRDRLKEAAQRLITDSHAPPMLRVDHVVRQFDEWYDAFDVGPDSSEWIAPSHRIRLFQVEAKTAEQG